MKRRSFIQKSVLASAGVVSLPILNRCTSSYASKKTFFDEIGIQLYTLRSELEGNLQNVLDKVAGIGYENLELFGYQNDTYFGITIPKIKKMIRNAGLKVKSGHYGTGRTNPNTKGTLSNGWEKTVEDAAELGQPYMVCPWLQVDERKSLDQYKELVELLNKCGEVCKRNGIKLTYHNHDFEFVELGGKIPMELLIEETDSNLVDFEMDIYWVHKAGVDPIELFEKYPGRFPLWHVKDMDETEEKFFTHVGNGVIDWNKMFTHANKAGLKHFFVEQDLFRNNNPFESVQMSYEYLTKLGKSKSYR